MILILRRTAGLLGHNGAPYHRCRMGCPARPLLRLCPGWGTGDVLQHQLDYQAKGNSSATPTSITTGDREELKKWMKEMERSGRTVNVTYDANTGVWSGTAYANLGGNTTSTAEELTYTGILTAAPMPVLEQPSINGSVLALQTSDDNTLIIATHGMMLLIEDSTDFSVFRYIDISLNGCVYQHYDLDGQIFLVLELSENQDNVLSL